MWKIPGPTTQKPSSVATVQLPAIDPDRESEVGSINMYIYYNYISMYIYIYMYIIIIYKYIMIHEFSYNML